MIRRRVLAGTATIGSWALATTSMKYYVEHQDLDIGLQHQKNHNNKTCTSTTLNRA
jgi:hypothetical protein